MSRLPLARTGVVAGTAAALAASALIAPLAADAKSHLHCRAAVSPAHPHRYSTIHVLVRSKAHVAVRTTAHYKTTDTTHAGRADSHGAASIAYYISSATAGHKVPVSVRVTGKHHTATCGTSFTPH